MESGPQMGRSVEKQVRWFWRFIMSPLMFGLVGASVNFKTIDSSIIPKSVAIIVAGQPPLHSTLQMHAVPRIYHDSLEILRSTHEGTLHACCNSLYIGMSCQTAFQLGHCDAARDCFMGRLAEPWVCTAVYHDLDLQGLVCACR